MDLPLFGWKGCSNPYESVIRGGQHEIDRPFGDLCHGEGVRSTTIALALLGSVDSVHAEEKNNTELAKLAQNPVANLPRS